MKIAIVGCGLIGNKRLKALGRGHSVVAAVDPNLDRARALASLASCEAFSDFRPAIDNPAVDAVVVATTNRDLAEITHFAIDRGKHVLVEKPAARNPTELEPLLAAAARKKVHVQVGFNHRFHPALSRAMEIYRRGEIGKLMFIRGRYGHGGRLGYDKEWRADPELAGGGELLDQGVHLIDLARWFLGDFTDIWGEAHTYFWSMPVEDNGFMSLRTAEGQVAFLHASCTEWKNLFSFEIYGQVGKLHVEGLGGSYGVERLSFYRMLPQMGPPETTIWEFPGEDVSFRNEFEAFVQAVETGKHEVPTLQDAKAALDVVTAVYRRSKSQ